MKIKVRNLFGSFIISERKQTMDEIRPLSMAEEKAYLKKIYSDRLRNQTRLCPDDGALMNGSGLMFLRKNIRNSWVVEYVCSKDGEIIRSWTPAVDPVIKEIARDVLGADGDSQ